MKEIANDPVHRQETLRVSAGFEPPHLSLALAGRLMGDFRSIVLVLLRAVNHRRHHEAVGRRVAAQLVGDQPSRRTALRFQQHPEEAFGGTPITPRLSQTLDAFARILAFQDVYTHVVQLKRLGQRIAHREALDNFSDELWMIGENVRVLFQDGWTDPRLDQTGARELVA
jgi:hypothetical protein